MRPELELVQKWLGRARTDLTVARASIDLPRPEPAAACFHCQQAVEKTLKAFLAYRDVEFEWSHAIKYLLSLCVNQDGAFEHFLESVVPLSEYGSSHK